jgi:hypothetical protein
MTGRDAIGQPNPNELKDPGKAGQAPRPQRVSDRAQAQTASGPPTATPPRSGATRQATDRPQHPGDPGQRANRPRVSDRAQAVGRSSGEPSGTTVGIVRKPMDPGHARGYVGEQGMGFEHYRAEEGWIFFEGPSGYKGHGVTERGFDAVAYNTRTDVLELPDNKSLKSPGNVRSATAIDPSKNLPKNLDRLIKRVEAAKDVPGRVRILGLLRQTKAALAAGEPLPKNVKLVVTSVGGQTTDVSGRLKELGVEHRLSTPPRTATPSAVSAPAAQEISGAAPRALVAPKTPGAPPVAEPHVPESATPKVLPRAFGRLGNIARGLGVTATVISSVQDAVNIIAEKKPEWLPKGKQIELMKPNPTPFRSPNTAVQSGYTVENQGGGRIIYRDAEGMEVPKATAMDALSGFDRL